MFKLSAIALALAFAVPAFAQQVCVTPDAGTSVTFGAYNTGVSNRAVVLNCTIDDQIGDEQAWGNQASFLAHVSKVSFDLLKQGKISAAERSKLMIAAQASGVGTTLKVKLIGFNDFHGYIKSREGSSSNPGVASFAYKINELRALNPLNAVVSAGDMIGASPLTSALFKDEPTIEAMNRIGIDFNAVGNHEFDEGKTELLRIQHGGNHPTDIYSGQGLAEDLKDGEFAGAKFKFLAANVLESESNQTIFPGVGIKDFMGNKMAFIGMTLESTPTIVSPSGVAGLSFRDEADTVNALVPQLKALGIESIVVLIHEGGLATLSAGQCTGVSGPIVDIVSRLDPAVDLVISGHTHQEYNCLLNNSAGKLVRVTSAGQYGRRITDIDVTLNTRTRDVQAITASNVVVPVPAVTNNTVPQVAELLEIVDHYSALSAVPAARVIGKITAAISKTNNVAGESALGDVIADAQRDASNDADNGLAVIAFMNPGGIRADLPFNAPNGDVTYGNAFTVQPFGNALVTMTLSGAQIKTALETQFAGCNGQTVERILQISTGFAYTYAAGNACNARVVSMSLNGVAIDEMSNYRVTVNSFLADGGDGFVVLKDGSSRLGGAVDTDAFEAYLQANPSGVAPGPMNRITKQ
ncbi:bifunctional metallophosphatase/5'-nucleotidase [Uliginosibacterium flavum]|uniref:Bifunctional metallophosphatase/5'-nucleotidase n=1 Tax=Uliginosibacterium flavum TaxID=1396831 RepID=A0ABV2TJE4_9RHOO